MHRARIRGNPPAGFLLRSNLSEIGCEFAHPSAQFDGWCASPQGRQAAFPFVLVVLLVESSLQAGMARCQQLVSSLGHGGQASHTSSGASWSADLASRQSWLSRSKLVPRRAGSAASQREVTRTREQLRQGSSSGHSMSQERPNEKGVDELEKSFAFG